MTRESGRSMIKNLIFLLIVGYVGFVIVKLITSNIEKTAIKSEVFNRVGEYRAEAENVVREKIIAAIENKGATPLSVTVTITGTNLSFSYSYELETDYFFTKTRQQISVTDSMRTYF